MKNYLALVLTMLFLALFGSVCYNAIAYKEPPKPEPPQTTGAFYSEDGSFGVIILHDVEEDWANIGPYIDKN